MGSKQFEFCDCEQPTARKRTKRVCFLAQMVMVLPWKALNDLIEPYYPKTESKGARPPRPLQTMLLIHRMQQWYDLNVPAMENELIEVPTMLHFAGIDLSRDRIPDEPTILSFRHPQEHYDIQKQIYCFAADCVYETVQAHLKANGMAMKQGTIVDATLIAAPSSTFTRAKPEGAGSTRTARLIEIPRCI
jgi:IS5 family transposase